MVLSASAQTLNAYEKKAAEAFEKKDFSAALAYYRTILEVDAKSVDGLYFAGESARQIRAYHLAEAYFSRVPDEAKIMEYELTNYLLADVKKSLGKYDEAVFYFQKYIEANENIQGEYFEKAKRENVYCEWALEMINNPVEDSIIHLDTTINTVYSDFAPLKIERSFYYTSAIQEKEETEPVTGIFLSEQAARAMPITENASEEGQHTSHIAFSTDGKRMYFTICEEKEALINEYQCEIWYRLKLTDTTWSKAHLLPSYINKSGYTTTQPSIGWDEKISKEVLFFASDRLGGEGKMDLWSSVIMKDTIVSQPQNLVDINTAQDDMTPFFHKESQTLFYSSNGRENLGGFDIFKTHKINGEEWAKPENIGYPINSSYDDLYYTFNSFWQQGSFASNRPGALCAEPEKDCSCNDIYQVDIQVDFYAWVFNLLDSTELRGVSIEIQDLETGNIDTIGFNENANDFYFYLKLEKEYLITATKDRYDPDQARISTKGIINSSTFKEKLYLRPQIDLIVMTFDAISKEPLNGTAIQVLNLTENSDSISINSEFSNESQFPLDFEYQYRVTAAKEHYGNASLNFSSEGFTRPTTIIKELYLTPFVGLPLTLYFDNDKPRYVEPLDTTTQLTYGKIYQSYFKRKRSFQHGYSRGLKGKERVAAKDEINEFFEFEVEGGYVSLVNFTDILFPYLEHGNSLIIELEGYASPLANSEYNKRLTGRRISSVLNHFMNYKEGVLAPYIEGKALIIREKSLGEEAAPKNLSDNKRDRRQSVYSPAASRERRVRILDIRAQEGILSLIKK